jgi:hypothetical protein
MGDEETAEYGSSDTSAPQSYGTPDTSTPTTATDDTSPPHDATTPDASSGGGITEALFNQLGALYGAGQYQDAVDVGKPYVDNYTSDPNWGRACYGLVMCFDLLRDWPNAKKYMEMLMAHPGPHAGDVRYQQQLACYSQSPQRNWTGDFLLY